MSLLPAAPTPAAGGPPVAVGARATAAAQTLRAVDIEEVSRRVYALLLADLRMEQARRGR